MALDIHKVRQICSASSRNIADTKRDVERIMGEFRNLGSGFTGDRLYSREYSQLDASVKDAVRALDKMRDAIRDIERKA